jgi:hypothetical protein
MQNLVQNEFVDSESYNLKVTSECSVTFTVIIVTDVSSLVSSYVHKYILLSLVQLYFQLLVFFATCVSHESAIIKCDCGVWCKFDATSLPRWTLA